MSQSYPTVFAIVFALAGSLTINFIVWSMNQLWQKTALWKRLVPIVPGVIGGLAAYWVWPPILSLAGKNAPALAHIQWTEYKVLLVCMGVAQGALATNIYKLVTQTFLGKDGVLAKKLMFDSGVGAAPPAYVPHVPLNRIPGMHPEDVENEDEPPY